MAQSLSVGRATISEYFRRADVEGLSWPLPDGLSDADPEQRLFPYSPGEARGSVPQPDRACVHAELRRKGVTLSLLWEEYRGVHPDGYGYSRYCELYTRREGKLSPVMRQRHPAGERLFVDHAGHTVDVVCPETGEVRTAQILVATSGASNYTYIEATWTQSLPDWISSHVRAFEPTFPKWHAVGRQDRQLSLIDQAFWGLDGACMGPNARMRAGRSANPHHFGPASPFFSAVDRPVLPLSFSCCQDRGHAHIGGARNR